jgi:Domain of unknown function (DUF4249)
MKKNALKSLLLCFVIVILANCREKYVLPNTGPAKGYLVVEGLINSGPGSTNIRLSRAVGLVDTVNVKGEVAAQVFVQGDDNSNQLLLERGNGLYSADQLTINDSRKYRLYIKTADGKEYQSDYSTVGHTPAIDTINWERNDRGVEIFVNAHGAQNDTKYYRWEYEETWEFHSFYYSGLKYTYNTANPPKITGVEPRPPDEGFKMLVCWQGETSSRILIGSTASLSRDSIHLAIQTVEPASWKLSVLYSIKIRQYAISAGQYDFLRRMKKNTEQVGSLFDAQPSELKGNIHCVSNPNEIVVGYMEVSDAQEKRIFINNSQVPNWGYRQFCTEVLVKNNPDSIAPYAYSIPTVAVDVMGLTIVTFNVAEPTCVDCTTKGVNVKPSFWP